MSATQPSDDNTALIGGIVGGVVALLIVVGVIAFIVLRNRKAKANQQSTNDGHALSPFKHNDINYQLSIEILLTFHHFIENCNTQTLLPR
jgi:hypothetical protein